MSNTIYSAILPVKTTDKNKHNYVYQITELSTGIKYIGSRGSKKLPAINDLKKYKSSTLDPLFESKLKYNHLNYYYEILSYHATRQDATIEESRLHFLYDVKNNNQYYNRSNQTANGFCTAGKANYKDNNGKIHFVNVNDPRIETGELVSASTGLATLKDKNGNTLKASVNDPRIETGELVGSTKGKVVVKSVNGHLQVYKNDERIKSGEFKYLFDGKAVVKDKDGTIFHVDNDDERIESGELLHLAVGKAVMKDKDGNNHQLDIDDPRIKTGEFVGATKGKTTVKDKYGNTFSIDKNDERIKSGDLIGVTGNWYSINGTIYSYIQIKFIFNISLYILNSRCKSIDWDSWLIIK